MFFAVSLTPECMAERSNAAMRVRAHGPQVRIAILPIADMDNPSFLYAIATVSMSMAGFTGLVAALRSAARNDPGPAGRTLGRVRADVEHAAIDEIFERGLEEFLSGVQRSIAQVCDEVVATYLRDEPQPSRLVGVARAAALMAAQQQQ